MVGAVKGGVQIKQFTVFFQRLEPMGKALGDVHAFSVLSRKSLSMPLQKRGRVLPDIDDHIKDRPSQAGDYLDFRFRRALKVHAPERACLSGEGMIDLQNMFAVEQILQFILTEKTGKHSPVILMGMGFKDKSTGQRKGMACHLFAHVSGNMVQPLLKCFFFVHPIDLVFFDGKCHGFIQGEPGLPFQAGDGLGDVQMQTHGFRRRV
jgi:hypothetical protein